MVYKYIVYTKTGKCYMIRNDKNNEKYIIKNRMKVNLKSITGQYRYIQHDPCEFLKSSSIIMNKEGDQEYIKGKKYIQCMMVPFFRKTFYDGSNNEYEIATLIKKKQKNSLNKEVVRIFNVNKHYYDVELLDVYYHDKSTLLNDIHECLKVLHSLHIIYIDLKEDNIGYSHIDKRWKIFDFDVSGIANDKFNSWMKEPPFYYAYKLAYKHFFNIPNNINILSIEKNKGEILPLNKIDDILYIEWKKNIQK